MKILHLLESNKNTTYPLGAPGRFVDFLCALRDKGHDNETVMPRYPVLQAALERERLKFVVKRRGAWQNIFRRYSVKKLLKGIQPDVILQYDNSPSRFGEGIIDNFDGPVRYLPDIYTRPVITPRTDIKKLGREESLTPSTDHIIGCFAPAATSLKNLEILFHALTGFPNISLWIALDPSLSEEIQDLGRKFDLVDKMRLYDVTVSRAAFYKACNIVYVPCGGTDSEISFAEAGCFGVACISSHHPVHLGRGLTSKYISENLDNHYLSEMINELISDEPARIKAGEEQRKVFENIYKPEDCINELLAHI